MTLPFLLVLSFPYLSFSVPYVLWSFLASSSFAVTVFAFLFLPFSSRSIHSVLCKLINFLVYLLPFLYFFYNLILRYFSCTSVGLLFFLFLYNLFRPFLFVLFNPFCFLSLLFLFVPFLLSQISFLLLRFLLAPSHPFPSRLIPYNSLRSISIPSHLSLPIPYHPIPSFLTPTHLFPSLPHSFTFYLTH